MNIEILPGSPILVEIEYVWIIVGDVKMVVDAASLGPRPINKTAQKFNQFCTFFRAGVQRSCEGATWVLIFLRSPSHHAANVHAIWFFNLKCEAVADATLFEARQFGRGTGEVLERHLA